MTTHVRPDSAGARDVPGAASLPDRCAAECTRAARLGATLFRNRGWLPLLFIAVPLIAPGRQSALSWAIGAVLLAAGEAFRLAGVAAAGTTTRRRSRDVQRLVTYGIFAWTRNPLYVGNLLAWLGVAVASGVFWFVPVAALIFAAEYSLIVRFEEGVLESTFGDEYLSYKEATPRWVPRPPSRAARAARGAGASADHDWREAWWSERSTLLQYAALAAALVAKQAIT